MEGKLGGGEMRRIHIIYFLNRTGRVEHPHLIRVVHLSRNGIFLRDVKRWLADLRGQDMPEAFAWSYKRKYKTGYVWQDLMDDDLISPISDNEYVLQGSQISSIHVDSYWHGEMKGSSENKQMDDFKEDKQTKPSMVEEENQSQRDIESEPMVHFSSKICSEITEEEWPQNSTDGSTMTEDSSNTEEKKKMEKNPVKKQKENWDNVRESLNKNRNVVHKGHLGSLFTSTLNEKSTSKSQSRGGASHILRNLIRCSAAIDTKDSVMVKKNISGKPDCSNKSAGISKGDAALGGSSAWVFGTCNRNQHQPNYTARKSWDGGNDPKRKSYSEYTNQNAPYKPVTGPNCSQCGKTFDPEKMYTHMKSCRRMKALCAMAPAATPTTIEKTTSSIKLNSSKVQVPCYLLSR